MHLKWNEVVQKRELVKKSMHKESLFPRLHFGVEKVAHFTGPVLTDPHRADRGLVSCTLNHKVSPAHLNHTLEVLGRSKKLLYSRHNCCYPFSCSSKPTFLFEYSDCQSTNEISCLSNLTKNTSK